MKANWVMALLAGVAVCGISAAWAGEGCGWKKSACGDKDGFAAKEISTSDLQDVVAGESQATIIDARSAQYDDGKRIPGAIALTSKASDEEIAAALPSKETAIVTYCSNTECPASNKLAKRLQDLGYTNVRKYTPGIQGWEQEGQKVVEVAAANSEG